MVEGGRSPWSDAYGVPVTEAARVVQDGVDKTGGALKFRRGRAGRVVTLGSTRAAVVFDGETAPVAIRPHLLHVIETEQRTEA